MEKEKDKYFVDFVEFSQVEIPKFCESGNKEYILFGEDNLFPNFLIDINRSSAINNAIITSKSKMTAGEEITFSNASGDGNDILNSFAENINSTESLHKVVKKLTRDYMLFGGFCLNTIWSKDRTQISEVYHIDFSCIRSGRADMRGNVYDYFFSNDWSNLRKNPITKIKSFDKLDRTEASQLIYFKPYSEGTLYYPLPDWVGAIKSVVYDGKIIDFSLSAIENNFQPGLWINFNNGKPSPEEMKKQDEKMSKLYKGEKKAGRYIISYSESKDKAPDITHIPASDLDKQYLAQAAQVMNNILVGHRITSPLLLGIKTPGQLGGLSEIKDSSELFMNFVISEYQQNIQDEIDNIIKINGFGDYKTKIVNSQPLKFTYSELMQARLLSKNEMRGNIMYPATNEMSVTEEENAKQIPTQAPAPGLNTNDMPPETGQNKNPDLIN